MIRFPRPVYGAPHTGPYDVTPPPSARATEHDELRQVPRPGMPGHAGGFVTRVLEVIARTPVYDYRGALAGHVSPGELVPVAKGVGPASSIVHVITAGRHRGRVIYRHRPGYVSLPPAVLEHAAEGPR